MLAQRHPHARVGGLGVAHLQGVDGAQALARLKGLGIPSLKSQNTGDQLFVIKIQIPTKLTARQKELLTEFAKESGMTMEEDGDGFFDKMKTFFE